MVSLKENIKGSRETRRMLKCLVSRLVNSGNNYSFVVAANGKSDCNVSVLSDNFSGMQQHVISMRCLNMTAQQAQALVSEYA